MARNRVEQIPEEYREDLNPEYEMGENHGPPRAQLRSAYELKDAHDLLRNLRDDQLKQIPILMEGSRLEQGATYFDLRHPDRGPFKALGDMVAGPDNHFVPKSEVGYPLWNLLIGVDDPDRLGPLSGPS
jgi:hypothetical protein